MMCVMVHTALLKIIAVKCNEIEIDKQSKCERDRNTGRTWPLLDNIRDRINVIQ